MAVKRTINRRPAVPRLVETVREYLLNRSMRERSDFHEKQIKAGSRKKKITLIEAMNPQWKDLFPDICA